MSQMQSPAARNRAFTVIELVVTILIIAILGAVIAPRLLGIGKSAMDTRNFRGLIVWQTGMELAEEVYLFLHPVQATWLL